MKTKCKIRTEGESNRVGHRWIRCHGQYTRTLSWINAAGEVEDNNGI